MILSFVVLVTLWFKLIFSISTAMKTDYDFDTLVDRRGTASMKWDRYKDRDVLPLWVADMDFLSPPTVEAALQERAAHGVFGYTGVPGALIDRVLSTLVEKYDWQVRAEWLVWLPGVVTGLNVACRAVGDDNDAVMTAVPVYPPFLTAPVYSKRRLVTVPLVQNSGRWEYDFDGLEKSITSDTKLFMFCHPHNPVGRVFDRKEIETLAGICDRHDIIVCSDEIHCDLILDQGITHIPTAVIDPDIAQRTITLMAPSKTFNIPGLGCSFAVIPNPSIRHQFKKTMAGIVPSVNTMGFAAALAAYRNGWSWLTALLSYLKDNRRCVTEAVAGMPGISMTHVEATYLAWIDTRATGLDEPARFFEAAGVGLSDGREFGGPGFVRLNFGCPRAILEKALGRMQVALDNLFH